MAEDSILWSTSGTGDGAATGYTATQLFDWLRRTFISDPTKEGVLAASETYATPLAVSGTATPVSVAAGAAMVYGIPYENTAVVSVNVATPSAGTARIDRIVLRADWTAQTVRITRIAGEEGADPAAPDLTQTAGTTWDVPLAQLRVTEAGAITVTDQRTYITPPTQISASQIPNGTITTALIGDEQVTAAKIANRTRSFLVQAVTAYVQSNGGSVVRLSINGWLLGNTVRTDCYAQFNVPNDYVSGLTVKGLAFVGYPGNFYSGLGVEYGAVGESEAEHTANVAAAAVAVTAGDICVVCTATLTDAAAGDIVSLVWTRDATNDLDTGAGLDYFMGFLVEYTADS